VILIITGFELFSVFIFLLISPDVSVADYEMLGTCIVTFVVHQFPARNFGYHCRLWNDWIPEL